MNCQDITTILDDHAAKELTAAQRNLVDEHLASCSNCRHAWTAQEALISQPMPDTPSDLVENMLRLFPHTVEIPSHGFPALWLSRPRVAWGMMAALIVVGVAVTLVYSGGAEQTVTPALSTGQMAETLAPKDALVDPVVVLPGGVRISVQLIDSELNAEDLIATQADIARVVAIELEALLSREEQESIETAPTTSPAAYALYLRALEMLSGSELRTALASLDRAIALDPSFANAYALKATYYANKLASGSAGEDSNTMERLALENAERALALSPDAAFAHLALGQLHQLNGRLEDARVFYGKAIELDPSLAETVEARFGRP